MVTVAIAVSKPSVGSSKHSVVICKTTLEHAGESCATLVAFSNGSNAATASFRSPAFARASAFSIAVSIS